ncbi:MAG: Stf0 family sulfotransferase [Solirubrobacterales bacterium]
MASATEPSRSYLICATPRSGSTLLCEALKGTGVAGVPEEYFEALRHSGRPRRPQEYFVGARDRTILRHLGEHAAFDGRPGRSPLWDRHDYEPFLHWAIGQGTTPNGVFGAKLMWGYFGDFVSLLREIPAYREVPIQELLPAAFPGLRYVRVVRANKVRQAVSLWKAVQTATWRAEDRERGDGTEAANGLGPRLKFHYRAIEHLLELILEHEACWDAFFEHCGTQPLVVVYEDFVESYEETARDVLRCVGVEPSASIGFERRMQPQSDDINRRWARRFSELKLNTDPDLATAEVL